MCRAIPRVHSEKDLQSSFGSHNSVPCALFLLLTCGRHIAKIPDSVAEGRVDDRGSGLTQSIDVELCCRIDRISLSPLQWVETLGVPAAVGSVGLDGRIFQLLCVVFQRSFFMESFDKIRTSLLSFFFLFIRIKVSRDSSLPCTSVIQIQLLSFMRTKDPCDFLLPFACESELRLLLDDAKAHRGCHKDSTCTFILDTAQLMCVLISQMRQRRERCQRSFLSLKAQRKPQRLLT